MATINQINYIILIKLINQIKNILSTESKLVIFQTYVRPLLDFGDIVWMIASDNAKRNICRQQERLAKLIFKIECDQSNIFQKVHWMPIADRQLLRFRTFISKTLVNGVPKILHELLQVKTASCTRSGSVITLQTPNRVANLRCADNLFAERACESWNSIEAELRNPDLVFPKKQNGTSFAHLLYNYSVNVINHRYKKCIN